MKPCECGCGKPAPIAKETNRKRGYVAGQPMRFIKGHWLKLNQIPRATGAANHRWNGGYGDNTVYPTRLSPGHPSANKGGHVREHILVAEKALGKHLPKGAHVHHVNGDKRDNTPSNLVICQDVRYHILIEKRTRALRGCGNANWLRCSFCGEYADPSQLYVREIKYRGRPWTKSFHRACSAKYARDALAKKKGLA